MRRNRPQDRGHRWYRPDLNIEQDRAYLIGRGFAYAVVARGEKRGRVVSVRSSKELADQAAKKFGGKNPAEEATRLKKCGLSRMTERCLPAIRLRILSQRRGSRLPLTGEKRPAYVNVCGVMLDSSQAISRARAHPKLRPIFRHKQIA
jgi:hypothetical protein